MVFRSAISSNYDAATNQPHVTIERADQQLTMNLYIKLGHQNMDYMRKTVTSGKMKGLPVHIPDLKYDCMCSTKSQKLLSWLEASFTDSSEPHKGDRIHAD